MTDIETQRMLHVAVYDILYDVFENNSIATCAIGNTTKADYLCDVASDPLKIGDLPLVET